MAVKINFVKEQAMAKIMDTFNANLEELSSEIMNDCNQYCKEDTGTLIASSLIHSDLKNGKLIWQTPYARRQYWEIRTAYKTVNPNASWRWCEVAKKRHMGQWEKQAQRLMEMSR